MLLEILPALVILLLATMGSMRLVWSAMEQNREQGLAHWRESVLALVWKDWRGEGGNVALVEATGDGLSTRFFPDSSWLPGNLEGPGSGNRMVLSRKRVERAGRAAWQISRLLLTVDGKREWQPVMVILVDSGSGNGS